MLSTSRAVIPRRTSWYRSQKGPDLRPEEKARKAKQAHAVNPRQAGSHRRGRLMKSAMAAFYPLPCGDGTAEGHGWSGENACATAALLQRGPGHPPGDLLAIGVPEEGGVRRAPSLGRPPHAPGGGRPGPPRLRGLGDGGPAAGAGVARVAPALLADLLAQAGQLGPFALGPVPALAQRAGLLLQPGPGGAQLALGRLQPLPAGLVV